MVLLSLRIKLDNESVDVRRTVRVDSSDTIGKLLQTMRNNRLVPVDGEYGLYLRHAANGGRHGTWLEEDRTLAYYSLTDEDTLEYISRATGTAGVTMPEEVSVFLQIIRHLTGTNINEGSCQNLYRQMVGALSQCDPANLNFVPLTQMINNTHQIWSQHITQESGDDRGSQTCNMMEALNNLIKFCRLIYRRINTLEAGIGNNQLSATGSEQRAQCTLHALAALPARLVRAIYKLCNGILTLLLLSGSCGLFSITAICGFLTLSIFALLSFFLSQNRSSGLTLTQLFNYVVATIGGSIALVILRFGRISSVLNVLATIGLFMLMATVGSSARKCTSAIVLLVLAVLSAIVGLLLFTLVSYFMYYIWSVLVEFYIYN